MAIFIFAASALVGTFGKRLVRIIGLAAMAFSFVGLALSLSHHGSAPSQWPITSNAPSINTDNIKNTNDQSGGTNILNIIGPQRLFFDVAIGDELASQLPAGKSIEIMAVGSRPDWNIADQYAQYLKAKGFDVSFSRSSETIPPPDPPHRHCVIFVWLADWASGGRDLGRRGALENLNQRLARGEIDRAEYEAKRKLIGAER